MSSSRQMHSTWITWGCVSPSAQSDKYPRVSAQTTVVFDTTASGSNWNAAPATADVDGQSPAKRLLRADASGVQRASRARDYITLCRAGAFRVKVAVDVDNNIRWVRHINRNCSSRTRRHNRGVSCYFSGKCGIPSEAQLKEMRAPEQQTFYLVGTPKGKIHQHEKKWLDRPWQKVRDAVEVKLYEHEGELYVLAKSPGRQAKETSGASVCRACCAGCAP
jgi:hypothetical protein